MLHLFPSRTVALALFGFPVHWYGLLYLLAFLLAWWLLPRLQRLRGLALSRDAWADVLGAAVLGVIVGGRLGFVLFYEPMYYLMHPLKVFAVWEGGMSSHGGFIGTALALLWVLRGRSLEDKLRMADVVVVPVALGLGLGRIGNFINQELYGTVTTLPFGMRFPGAEGLRHPTQIYAFLKDMCIALICLLHLQATKVQAIPGRTFALFLMLYGVLRFMVEHFREQTYPLFLDMLTRGQLLTIPVFLVGVWLWWWAKRKGD